MATVTLFLKSGETFTFRNAKVRGDSERELFLTYKAVSDGQIADLRVRKEAIVAHSVKEG
jgi:hypothetical protein